MFCSIILTSSTSWWFWVLATLIDGRPTILRLPRCILALVSDSGMLYPRVPSHRLLRWHNREIIAFPTRYQRSYHGTTPDIYGWYTRISPFALPMATFLRIAEGCLSITSKRGRVTRLTAEIKLSVLFFAAILQVFRVGSVKRLQFRRQIEGFERQDVLVCFPIGRSKSGSTKALYAWMYVRMSTQPLRLLLWHVCVKFT